METNKVTIYLIGQITSDPETYEWRRRVRERFKEHEKNPTPLSEDDFPGQCNMPHIEFF